MHRLGASLYLFFDDELICGFHFLSLHELFESVSFFILLGNQLLSQNLYLLQGSILLLVVLAVDVVVENGALVFVLAHLQSYIDIVASAREVIFVPEVEGLVLEESLAIGF
jgi:hypothetical protein